GIVCLALGFSRALETISNTKNPTSRSVVQPTVGHSRERFRPKCHGRGLEVRVANSTAAPTKIASWIRVAIWVKAGDAVPGCPPATRTTTLRTMIATSVIASPVAIAAGPYQVGQRGNGLAPSGNSGGSGGGGWGNA